MPLTNISPAPGLKIGVISTAGSAFSMSANDLHFVRFVATYNCTINVMTAFKSAQAAGIISVMGIYSNSGNFPSTLLGQTGTYTTVVGQGGGSADGGIVNHTMLQPLNLVAGTVYWLAYMQNTTANMENSFNAPTTGTFIHQAQSSFTTTLPATVTGSFPASGGFTGLGAW